MIGRDELDHRFGVHKARLEGPAGTDKHHAEMRIQFKAFAQVLDQLLPDSREKTIAFTELETASMWAHKALAMGGVLLDDHQIVEPPKEIEGLSERDLVGPEAPVSRYPH